MKSTSIVVLAILTMTGIAFAKDPPDAPSAVAAESAIIEAPISSSTPVITEAAPKLVDSKFISLAIISTGSTFADSYTTLFARQNWLAGKTNVCNMEVQSPYLYGTHPTVARTYAVASVKSASSVAAAYLLRKHHSRFWAAPLLANAAISLEGVTQNMMSCN